MTKKKTTPVVSQIKIPLFDKDAMHLGFTGTRKGLKNEQFVVLGNTLKYLVEGFIEHGYKHISWHHGDCLGADEMFHKIIKHYKFFRETTDLIHIHPPQESRFRAYCKGNVMHDEKPYLVRNRDIVDLSQGLVACPDGKGELLRSGTWQTIRYARKNLGNIIIIYPDGTIDKEMRGLVH